MKTKPRELADEEALTQFGCVADDPPYHDCPRSHEPDLSMLVGEHSVEGAARYVRRSRTPQVDSGGKVMDVARYTTVGTLRFEGFSVQHTPTRKNPYHVSVEVPAGEWDYQAKAALGRCFPEPGGEGDG